MGIFELGPWSRDQGEVLAETCQLVLFDPTLLICEKKRGVGLSSGDFRYLICCYMP